MKAAQGILTARGGMTSHAAVVARGMGTCCVSGCSAISNFDEDNKTFVLAGKTYREGCMCGMRFFKCGNFTDTY